MIFKAFLICQDGSKKKNNSVIELGQVGNSMQYICDNAQITAIEWLKIANLLPSFANMLTYIGNSTYV